VPEPAALDRTLAVIRAARRPLIIAGGGVIYSEATAALAALAEAAGIPVAETQAGKGALPYDHPLAVGAVGSTGTTAANQLARDADVVIGVGTRYSDFTTASQSAFADPGVRFVNVNVAPADAVKLSGTALVADAREALTALSAGLVGWSAGDLHKLWRTRDPKGYHVEYGYSCMGYEIAGGLGAKLAAPEREVFVLVGDGSYLMMAQELVTAVAERVKLVVVLVDNHGFASIGALSESVGSQRFGTSYRYRSPDGRLDGDYLPVDLAANAESLGVRALRARNTAEFRAALRRARAADETTLVYVETDPLIPAPDGGGWWDVPVAETAVIASTRTARAAYEAAKRRQREYL
jgi:3D-(3,5/4)-trihydroxycyclohexane-1,2-dione acylhydrolase (decyclizing)